MRTCPGSLRRGIAAVAAALLILTGCGAGIELMPHSGAVPAGVDLSGSWRLRADSEAANRRIDGARGGLVHVFLETGASLKTTQTDSGLFISFDRSVVEEYRFGENREANVGPVAVRRVSGWEGQSYVIETLDDDGLLLRERYWLGHGGDTLHRQVVIEKKARELLDVEVVFSRRQPRDPS